MLWIARSGAQWRELPEVYGPWQSVYARFAKWRDGHIGSHISCIVRKCGYGKPEFGLYLHQGSRKSQIVDGLGNPVEFILSGGNDHDSVHAVELLEKVKISGSNVLADRAYGAETIRAYISEHGASDVIPPQSNVSDP